VASLSQGRTAAAQCGLFTYKSVPVIFEPPCTSGSDPRIVGVVGYWWSANRISELKENDGKEYKHRSQQEACLIYTPFVNAETTTEIMYYGTKVIRLFFYHGSTAPSGPRPLIIEDS